MTTLGLEEDSYIATISKTAVAIWCAYRPRICCLCHRHQLIHYLYATQ